MNKYLTDEQLASQQYEQFKTNFLNTDDLPKPEVEEEQPTATTNTATPTTPEPKDPREYGFKENVGELKNAVTGGLVDLYNSVGSLPKLLDKRFYQPTDPKNPWKYDAPWLIKNKPVTNTVWGNFLRTGIEMVGGFAGTGKVMWGVKGLKGIATAARATRIGKIGTAAITGATYDAISNQSQESNLARVLVDTFPNKAGVLEPLATTETMSPAMKSFYNIGEGLGIGAFFDVAFEGAGWGLRATSNQAKKAAKKITGNSDPLQKALDNSRDSEYLLKEQYVERGAKQAFERSEYRKFKNALTKSDFNVGTRVQASDRDNFGTIVGKDKKGKIKVNFVNPQTQKSATISLNRNQLTPIGADKGAYSIDEWRMKAKPWEKLDDSIKKNLMQEFAEKNDVDYGEYRDLTRRARQQGDANRDLEIEQLEIDLSRGGPRKNPAYYKGGDITDNQALSTSGNPVESVRDMIEIRNNPTQKYGSPRGGMTEANIRRVEYSAPGMMLDEINSVSKQLKASPSYQRLAEKVSSKAIDQDKARAYKNIIQFLDESGHSRLIDVPEEQLLKYIGDPTDKIQLDESLPILGKAQIDAVDAIVGQMVFEARDLSKAALSVSEAVDTAADGSLLDSIFARYSALGRLRKEASAAASARLKGFGAGTTGGLSKKELIARASDQAANDTAMMKELIKTDPENALLEGFLHFSAEANGSTQTFKDFQAFFKKKLRGYRKGDEFQRNALVNEMMTMGINSMLSGPKTPVRALVGTGLGTMMRPVATILGAVGQADDTVMRGAFATVGGMIDARNEAWKKAVADFQSYSMKEDGFRGFIQNQKDVEWEGMMAWAETYGTLGDRAMAKISDSMRGINKIPVFNYGPRVMRSMDTFFTQIIGRGRQRQLAFNHVYDKVKSQGLIVSDADLDDLVKGAEVDFENRVFTSDGMVSDEMAKFASDEAKLTKELTGVAKDFDRVFERAPYLRPFFLFARTGVNALTMTSKYTPVLNSFITEHVDIMTKSFDHPDMIQYGIKTAEDLDIARATMKGRMAIGYGFTSLMALAALNGNITGNGPPDRQLRESWRTVGKWEPRSFKIGDSYISYEALEPFNGILGFIGDVVDSQKVMGDEWVSNNFGKISYMISANVINKSFLAGILQLSDLFTSQGNDAPRVAANFVNNQIPLSGLRNEIGKVISPGVRELESGFWQSVGNRNLWADLITKDNILPYRYDELNGEILRDWDPLTRIVNAVLPINLNVGNTNETRELLMRSGLNLKQTFHSGPGGESLENYPDLKSKYRFYMGQQNVEAQLTELFAKYPDMKESIMNMEEDRAKGRNYEPRNTEHGEHIFRIIRTAKSQAWMMLLEDPQLGGQAKALSNAHELGLLADKARKSGAYADVTDIEQQIEQIKNIRK